MLNNKLETLLLIGQLDKRRQSGVTDIHWNWNLDSLSIPADTSQHWPQSTCWHAPFQRYGRV